jgi:hypothetical protein
MVDIEQHYAFVQKVVDPDDVVVVVDPDDVVVVVDPDDVDYVVVVVAG